MENSSLLVGIVTELASRPDSVPETLTSTISIHWRCDDEKEVHEVGTGNGPNSVVCGRQCRGGRIRHWQRKGSCYCDPRRRQWRLVRQAGHPIIRKEIQC